MAEWAGAGLGREVARFGFDPRKIWPFMVMLAAMIALGAARVWSQGLGEAWGIAFLLILLPGFALVMLLSELRLAGPVLVIGEQGLLDQRRGPEPVAWTTIQEATLRRGTLSKGIRIMLTSGERYDIELGFLAADPAVVMRQIRERAAKA